MPILKDFRTTKTITLPSYPDSVIEIFDSIIVGQMKGVSFKDKTELEEIIEALPLFIKSWNFTDEAEQSLEINRDNLNFLSLEDVKFLGEQILEFNTAVKKKLSDSQLSQ